MAALDAAAPHTSAPMPAGRARTWALVTICAAAYLYVFPYFPQINNPNENVRFYMTAAIVEDGTYAIDGARARWGWVNDAAVHEGRVYSVKAPGTSFLGVPVYAAYFAAVSAIGREPDRETALWLCRVTASVLPALVWLFFFHRWLLRRTRFAPGADAILISVALGSLLFAYAILFVSHTASAAAAFGAFMLLFDARHERRTGAPGDFLAGLLAAAVTMFEYPGVIASAVLSLYAVLALRRPARLAWFAAGALVPVALVMHFQWAAFGSPFTPGHRMLENPSFRGLAQEGFFGASTFSADAAVGLAFDPGYGLFTLTPVLLFAFIGFPLLLRRRATRADASVALAIIILTWVAICFMNNWRGGWTVGPRYLAALVPFVAWGALEGLAAAGARWPLATIAIAVGLTAYGLIASGAPSAWYPHIPEDIRHPVPHLIAILWAHDYAPHNAGNLVGLFGIASMLPLVAVAIGSLLVIAWSKTFTTLDRAFILGGAAALVSAAVVAVFALVGDPAGPSRQALGFVTSTWSPAGHDLAARLSARIARQTERSFDDYRTLVDLYLREGRDREAAATRLRGRLVADHSRE